MNDTKREIYKKMGEVSKDEGRTEFIEALEETLKELKAGRNMRVGVMHIVMDISEKDIPADIPETERKELVERISELGQSVFAAVGPQDHIVKAVADQMDAMGMQQEERHTAECHDPDCDITPKQARAIPFLKVMAAYMTNALMKDEIDVDFLLDNVRDTATKVKALSMMKGGVPDIGKMIKMLAEGNEDTDESGAKMVALEGETARAIMQAAAAQGLLPDELQKVVKEDQEKNGPAQPEQAFDVPEGTTMVQGNHKTKH